MVSSSSELKMSHCLFFFQLICESASKVGSVSDIFFISFCSTHVTCLNILNRRPSTQCRLGVRVGITRSYPSKASRRNEMFNSSPTKLKQFAPRYQKGDCVQHGFKGIDANPQRGGQRTFSQTKTMFNYGSYSYRKTNQNNMSFIMLAGRYANIIASFYAYIVLVLLSPISGSNGAGFQHVVIILSPSCSLNKLFLKGPDSMTHACPKNCWWAFCWFYFVCVCGTSDMSST